MQRTLLNLVFKQLLLVTTILSVGLLIGASWLNHYIFSPSRRPLQTYQQERLQYPAHFGLRIREHVYSNGQVPYLLVEPAGQLSEKGKQLRQQMAGQGIPLVKFGQIRGILILLHGRNGRKETLLPVAERFTALGYRCLIPDLPGHGNNQLKATAFGSSEFERSLPRHLLIDAREYFHLPIEPAGLWGMSMGGAFAVSAASEAPQLWHSLIVVSSFDSLPTVLNQFIPQAWQWSKPLVYPLLDFSQWLQNLPSINTMQPQVWAQQVQTPSLVIHGNRDRFIPLQQGKILYQALAAKQKRWLSVENGGHANLLSSPLPLYAEMGKWLNQTMPKSPLANP